MVIFQFVMLLFFILQYLLQKKTWPENPRSKWRFTVGKIIEIKTGCLIAMFDYRRVHWLIGYDMEFYCLGFWGFRQAIVEKLINQLVLRELG